MKKNTLRALTTLLAALLCLPAWSQDLFPDGTPVGDWFRQTDIRPMDSLGTPFVITDHGVNTDSTVVQTEQIQAVIDQAAAVGGGVVIVPAGTFLSGSLFFRPGTHLHLEEGARLKGSDDPADFAIVDTRIEGQSVKYFAALVNADGVDGFTLSGQGTIDGNGLRYWRAFWLRRKWNPKCTNMDEQRPRLVYISRSKDVQLSGVRLINSPFWTTHLYRCERVQLLGLHIFAPAAPVKAPSSDAVDVDACTDVLIKGCYMSVNDDAVALKGGKGPWADQAPENGGNERIIIEDCTYGFCHSGLTCGSECIYCRNIVLRRCTLTNASRLLWLKMRPDTPQHYEYIAVEDISGDARSLLLVKPWTQFFDLKGREDMPLSRANNVTLRRIRLECNTFFDVAESDQYTLQDFTFEDLDIVAGQTDCNKDLIQGVTWNRVKVQQKP